MKVLLITVLYLIIFTLNINPQTKPLVSQGDLQFYVDCTSFMGKEGKTFQEFYLVVYADQLKLSKNDDRYSSEILIKTTISDNAEQISSKEWNTHISYDSIQDIRTMVVYDRWQELLDPGNYNLRIKVSDREKRKTGIIDAEISVPYFKFDDFTLSDIKFISNVSKKDSDEQEITPNPSRRYGILNPILYFYYELYLSEKYKNKNLTVKYFVVNETGKIIKLLSGNDVNTGEEVIGYTQAVDVSKIPSGVYTFSVEISDTSNNKSVKTQSKFEILQADYLVYMNSLLEKDAKTLGQILSYIATPQEVDLFNSLNSQSKADYIISFFKRKDPNPTTPENEYLSQIIARYRYANDNFSWGQIEGSYTERGRVFIQNGKPDEIVYYNSGMDTTPYEVWYYRTNREVYYIFADVKSNGQYILVHSSKEGEIKNQSWKQQVIRN